MTQEQMLKALRKIFRAVASLYVDYDGKPYYLRYEVFIKQVNKECDVTKEEYEAVLRWVEDEKDIRRL